MITIFDAKPLPGPPGATNVQVVPLGTDEAPRMVGPFAMVMRHATAPLPPGALPVDADVRSHPHIGLCAISYLLDGHITHRDSLGYRSELGPGAAGFFTAGSGAVHSERLERLRLLGGVTDLFQLLLALPDGGEDVPPSYVEARPEAIPVEETDGATIRWLGHPSPELRAPLPLPGTLLADVTLAADARWTAPEVGESAVFVWQGEVTVDGERVGTGQTALLSGGTGLVRALAPTRLLAFGGAPVGPRYQWWNYIHSSLERIEAARTAWREGRVELPPGDTESFTPAPPDDGRPLRRFLPG